MRKFIFVVSMVLMALSTANAGNSNPSSGRRLRSGHYLTCWSETARQARTSPNMQKDTPQDRVDRYRPSFKGTFKVEVKDTWEEWVTRSGSDCGRCGQTCTTSGSGNSQTTSCSCNFCSWQELETFYAPWSVQTVTWYADFRPNAQYRQKRIHWYNDWVNKGRPELHQANVQTLLEFDPDRPVEYFLFPGEVEHVEAYAGSGSYMSPEIKIKKKRSEYTYKQNNSLGKAQPVCDDVDFSMRADIFTGKRLVTKTPNSLEFRHGWAEARRNADGTYAQEPAKFHVTDLAARRYSQADNVDLYKDTKIQLWLDQVDRWWWFDGAVTKTMKVTRENSRLEYDDWNSENEGAYTIQAKDLMRTPHFGFNLHLKPKKTYMLCSRMLRSNNAYYSTKTWLFWTNWSEENCAEFRYQGPDNRSFFRKTQDFVARMMPIGLF